MKIVLHIGAWKTGSSAIQMFMRRNHEGLAARGVYVPKSYLEVDGFSEHVNALIHEDDTVTGPYLDELRGIAASHPDGTLVLSSEHYWPLSEAQLKRIVDRLHTITTDIQVLLYVRPQDDMWASLYAQQAKFFTIKSATPKWGGYQIVGKGITDRAIYYDRCLSVFRRLFGDSNVHARMYARSAFVGGDVITDFLAYIGIGDFVGTAEGNREVNVSLGWKGVAFSIWFADELHDKLLAENKASRAEIRRAFRMSCAQAAQKFGDEDWYGKGAEIFDGSERTEIRAHYEADNQALFDRFFEGEDVFGPVKSTIKSLLSFESIPAAEQRFVTGRFLQKLKGFDLDTAVIEDSLPVRQAGMASKANVKRGKKPPQGPVAKFISKLKRLTGS